LLNINIQQLKQILLFFTINNYKHTFSNNVSSFQLDGGNRQWYTSRVYSFTHDNLFCYRHPIKVVTPRFWNLLSFITRSASSSIHQISLQQKENGYFTMIMDQIACLVRSFLKITYTPEALNSSVVDNQSTSSASNSTGNEYCQEHTSKQILSGPEPRKIIDILHAFFPTKCVSDACERTRFYRPHVRMSQLRNYWHDFRNILYWLSKRSQASLMLNRVGPV